MSTIPYIHDNLFEINDNLKVYQKTIGSFQYLYVDDFYKMQKRYMQCLKILGFQIGK